MSFHVTGVQTCALPISYNEAPHKFEAGTPPILQAIGFGAALDWLNQFDKSAVLAHEQAVYQRAYDGVRGINGLRDRKSVVQGKSVDLGGRRNIKKKTVKIKDIALEDIQTQTLLTPETT